MAHPVLIKTIEFIVDNTIEEFDLTQNLYKCESMLPNEDMRPMSKNISHP